MTPATSPVTIARIGHLGLLVLLVLLGAAVPGVARAADTAAEATQAQPPVQAQWVQVPDLSDIQMLFPSTVDAAVVYVADAQKLWLSQDYGQTFSVCSSPSELAGPVTAMLFDPIRTQRLYAGTMEHGISISDDNGHHWRACAGDIHTAHIHSLVFSSTDRSFSTIYATHGLDQPGISESVDAGSSWHSFAADYDLAGLVVLEDAFFCAATNATQGSGFFRHDASKGWYCVLPEPPRVVMASPADPHRLWFSSRDTGISRSDNSGISTTKVGPPDIDVEAMAIDLTATGQETVFAFAPQTQGVISSSDGFATWQSQTRGLEPSEWIQEGARLAISADGSTLYASANGHLLRCPRQSQPPLVVRAVPSVAVAGGGPLVVQVTCPGAHEVLADCSGLGGGTQLMMHDDGLEGDEHANDGVFSLCLDELSDKLTPGMKVITVHATMADNTVRAGRAAIRVLPPASDMLMWDSGKAGLAEARLQGAWVGSRALSALRKAPYLHLHCDGPGKLILPFLASDHEQIASKDHALICFAIRSDQAGPLPLQFAVHDNGQGSGSENTQLSNVVSIDQYLPVVDGQLRMVSIPLGDLLEGSTCSPTLIDITISSTIAIHRDIDIYGIDLLAQTGPTITDVALVPLADGHLSIALTARGRDVRPLAATVRIAASAQPLPIVGPNPLPEAGAGLLTALGGDLMEQDTASFGATIPVASLAPGIHHLELQVTDANGITINTYPFLVPTQPPKDIPGLPSHPSPERLQAALAAASDFSCEGGEVSMHAHLAWEPTGLDLRLEVVDGSPEAYHLPPNITPAALQRSPHVQLVIQCEAPATAKHQLQVAWTLKGPRAWCDGALIACDGQRTAGGYVLSMHAPIVLREHALPGPGNSGRLAYLHWTFISGDRHLLSWVPGHAEDADTTGLAVISDPGESVQLTQQETALHAIELIADKPLSDDALAVASWAIAGEHPSAVQISSDHRRAWLVPAQWPPSQVAVTASGVHGLTGEAVVIGAPWSGVAATAVKP